MRGFDPFPYGLLTMVVSLEAIFLSTFVLISQNRLSEETERRADLALHIGLLTEHELTRVLQMLDVIQEKMGIVDHENSDLADLEMETKRRMYWLRSIGCKPLRPRKGRLRMSKFPDRRINAEAEYRNIFEAASDGLVIYDIEKAVIVEANPAACSMHGYTHEEFIGLNPRVFIVPENLVLFMEHVHMVETDNTFEALVVHLHKDGTPFHAEVSRSSIYYQGRPCLLSVDPGCQSAYPN